jgi:DNA-binding NtrC family response regulator
MDRARVLVVEDRPSVLKVIATILESGYEVTTASGGATAMCLIASRPFEVVLTDVRMPGASGFDVLRAVQAHGRLARVVMMTAYANVPDAVAAIKLGAFDYVSKPLDADEIALVVARAAESLRETEEREDLAADRGDEGVDRGWALDDVSVGFHHAVEEARVRASRNYLEKLMRHFRGNVTQAATRAGMTRESLHRVMRTYGIRSDDYKDAASDGAAPHAEANPVPLAGWTAPKSRAVP